MEHAQRPTRHAYPPLPAREHRELGACGGGKCGAKLGRLRNLPSFLGDKTGNNMLAASCRSAVDGHPTFRKPFIAAL